MQKAMIISRCSTNETRQDVTRQTADLSRKYSPNYEIVKVIEYYKSGRKNDNELNEILIYAVDNGIQHILFTEVSRIARRVIEILIFVEKCTEHKINVIIDNYNMHSLNCDKAENPMTKTMLQIGASFSEMELRHTQNRLNSGRAKYIAEGGVLGRKPDSKQSTEKTLEKHRDIVKYLKQGQSVRNIMKLTEKSNGTVQKIKQLMAA
jgi:DNA invertase Pin-like site-specific DNA recombinase